jgi:hypothetical protein
MERLKLINADQQSIEYYAGDSIVQLFYGFLMHS